MTTVLVSGSAGFIGGYVVEELLQRGYEVIGVDNFSKYGPVKKSYDDHPSYRFVEADCRDTALMEELLTGADHFIAGAAMIGGIPISTPMPTTFWPPTNGSWPPRSTLRSRPTAAGSYAR